LDGPWRWQIGPGAVAVYYAIIAALCLAVPYATSSRVLAESVFPYTSGPFALVSIALSLYNYLRRRQGWIEVAIATLWGAGAVALSTYVGARPPDLHRLFLYIQIQSILSGSAAVAMLLAAYRTFREASNPLLRVTNVAALLGLAIFLGRRCLLGLGVLPSGGGIDAIAHGVRLTQRVLVGCAVAILLALLVPRMRLAFRRGSRPTTR